MAFIVMALWLVILCYMGGVGSSHLYVGLKWDFLGQLPLVPFLLLALHFFRLFFWVHHFVNQDDPASPYTCNGL
jgi:hypothetical protein